MTTPFVIIANQRSGSNLLALALHEHPNALCYGELFRQKIGKDRQPSISNESRYDRPAEYLANVIAYGEKNNYSAVGFKLMIAQWPRLRRELIESSLWKKIILRRDNLLASYSSWLYAKRTRHDPRQKPEEKPVFNFAPGQFEEYCRAMEERWAPVIKEIDESGQNCLAVEYSEMTSFGFGPILDFLGLPQTDLKTIPKKQTSNILARFSNKDQVADYLAKIGKTDWLSEGAKEL